MIYVGDVARVIVHALFAPDNPGEVISAGTGRATTVLDVADQVIAAAGSDSRLEHVPMRAGEPDGSVVLGDPSTLPPIGFDPDTLTPFPAGIARTVAWYRQNPKALGPEHVPMKGQQPSRSADVSERSPQSNVR
jgi:nucleoside-diphosphate-sugar epimerase